MDFAADETHEDIRQAVRALCSKFPDEYWAERTRSTSSRGTSTTPSSTAAGWG